MNSFERGLRIQERLSPIPDFPNYYASPEGDIWVSKGCVKHKKLRPATSTRGYLSVTLSRDGKQSKRFIHRTILEAFIGPCPEGMECCHRNGIKTDNTLENLRWDTHASNMNDRYEKERRKRSRKC